MNDLKQNERMERLARLSEKQPDAISSEQRMSLGLHELAQHHATNGLTADDRLKLAGLKQSLAQDVLSPSERITKSVEILNLEEKNK
jgi:hypothetical protein